MASTYNIVLIAGKVIKENKKKKKQQTKRHLLDRVYGYSKKKKSESEIRLWAIKIKIIKCFRYLGLC